MSRYNECVETCLGELRRYGITGEVNFRSKHVEVCWNYDGKQRSVIVSATPSDHRSVLNERARVRRILRADGKQPVEPQKVTSFRNVIAPPKPVRENDREKLHRLEQEVTVLTDLFFDLYEQVQNARATVEVSFGAEATKPARRVRPSRAILTALSPTEWKLAGEVARANGINAHSMYSLLYYFLKQGLVEKHAVRGGGWRLTALGVEKRNALGLAPGNETPQEPEANSA